MQQLADALNLDDGDRGALAAAARSRVAVPDLPAEGHAPPPPASNLPPEPTSFVGREGEIAAISALLLQPAVRLVTLTGPGGIGKTRLALRVAASLLDTSPGVSAARYSDGVFFVALAPIADSDLIPAALAAALSLPERSGETPTAAVIAHLRTRRALLVLDNFEHVLEGRAFVGELLEACPALQILVTSRTILELSWEHVFDVPALGLSTAPAGTRSDAPAEPEAVALFVERARAAKADFSLTPENAETVAEICRTLEGIPLAIELAAARLRLFPPQALLGRLSQRLQFLTGGARDLPGRHQTLRAAIDWSYTLLSEEEKRLFARLSVFRGGCTLEAAEGVCNAEGDLGPDVLNGVASLVGKSLLRQEGEQEPRFVMLETIREYAGERLAEIGDSDRCDREHARYYLGLAEEAASILKTPDQRRGLERLEPERGNLRTALQWARAHDEVDHGLRLALALQDFWMIRGPLSEGRQRLERLADNETGTPALRAAAFTAAAKLAGAEGRRRRSAELTERAMLLYQQLGDDRAHAEAVSALILTWYLAGEVDQVAELLHRSEREGRETGNKWLVAVSVGSLASLLGGQGDLAEARRLGEESLALYQELGVVASTADMLRILAGVAYGSGDRIRAREQVAEMLALLRQGPLDSSKEEWLEPLAYQARMQGDYEYASRIFSELITRAEAVGDRRVAAHARTGLGLLAREQGDYDRAEALLEDSVSALAEVGDVLGRCRAVVGLSDVARDRGDAERVIEHAEHALALLEESGDAFFTGFVLHNLGLAAWYQEDRDRAQRLLDQALDRFVRQKAVVDLVEIRTSRGFLALDGGEYERARELFATSLLGARDISGRWMMASILEGAAGVAAGTGEAERAAQLIGAAEALRQDLGTPRPLARQRLHEATVATAVSATGDDRYQRAVEQGRELTLEEAISLVLGEDA